MTRLVCAAAIVLLLVLDGAPVLAVSGPGFGPHSGKIGRHYVVDDPSYPGAQCKYDGSGNLKSINPEPPIGYAFDSSSKTDSGEVGYRTVLQAASSPTAPDGQWRDVDTTTYTQDGTTDKINVDWPGHKTVEPARTDPNAYYRLAVQFRWTTGHYTRTIGKATHYVMYYANLPIGGVYRIACPGHQVLRGVMPAAALRPGVHLLFDNDEYPGGTCRYGLNSNGRTVLLQTSVRAPIVYAIDRSSDVDHQKVAWRFRQQVTDVRAPGSSDWKTAAQSDYARITAYDNYNAQWSARTLRVTNPNHLYFRLVVDIRWLSSTGKTQVETTSFVTRYLQRTSSRVLVASSSGPCPGLR